MTEEQKDLTAVEKKVDQLMEGKPEVKEEPKIQEETAPSMIEEARQLREELQGLRDEIKTEREKLDNVHAQAILGGKSLLGETVEKTKEEKAAEEARNILQVYGK